MVVTSSHRHTLVWKLQYLLTSDLTCFGEGNNVQVVPSALLTGLDVSLRPKNPDTKIRSFFAISIRDNPSNKIHHDQLFVSVFYLHISSHNDIVMHNIDPNILNSRLKYLLSAGTGRLTQISKCF